MGDRTDANHLLCPWDSHLTVAFTCAEEPQHSAKKVATEANMAGARVETIPSSIPQAGGLSYAIPPQVSMHMGVYPQQ